MSEVRDGRRSLFSAHFIGQNIRSRTSVDRCIVKFMTSGVEDMDGVKYLKIILIC